MKSNKIVDVVVIGCGAMGSSACSFLAARGASVIGIEQFSRGHSFGSSHGYTRKYRESYHEHYDYVPLIMKSGKLWQQMEAEMDEQLLLRCDNLIIGRPSSKVIQGMQKAGEMYNLPWSMLTREEVMNQYPQFRVNED
jgi:glycine/D-amino acid oxidase-like deaminating enzyme